MNEYDVISTFISTTGYVISIGLFVFGLLKYQSAKNNVSELEKEIEVLKTDCDRLERERDSLISELYKGGENNG